MNDKAIAFPTTSSELRNQIFKHSYFISKSSYD